MTIAITRHGPGAGELRREAARCRDARAARRMLALALVLEGSSREEAARAAGMDRQTLRDWVHRYNAEGLAGLRDRPRSGRRPRLIPNPADQCGGELGGVTAGHQAKWVAALITSGMSARVRQRSLSAASRPRAWRSACSRPPRPPAARGARPAAARGCRTAGTPARSPSARRDRR